MSLIIPPPTPVSVARIIIPKKETSELNAIIAPVVVNADKPTASGICIMYLLLMSSLKTLKITIAHQTPINATPMSFAERSAYGTEFTSKSLVIPPLV